MFVQPNRSATRRIAATASTSTSSCTTSPPAQEIVAFDGGSHVSEVALSPDGRYLAMIVASAQPMSGQVLLVDVDAPTGTERVREITGADRARRVRDADLAADR